jgi:hypothetical protein
MPSLVGVSFPLPKLYVSRFFDDGKTVFIKSATLYKDLQVGMKFIFYQSHEDTGYIGEATIKKITLAEDPYSFYKIYENDIFLTRSELENYIETKKTWAVNRTRRKCIPKSRKWLAIELDSIQKYDMPIKPKQFVPAGGKYIRSD